MENVENVANEVSADQTFKFFLTVGGILTVFGSVLTIIKFFQEQEIARKTLEKAKKKS
jgi:hypothetical protein